MRSYKRCFVWFAFTALIVSAAWSGYHHFFGAGFFRPVIEVKERIINLGTVPAGEAIPCEFTITNGGYRSLVINRVHPGCAGCIEVISYPVTPIKRHQSAVIRAALQTESLKGPTKKAVIVDSNDPLSSAFSLQIEANVSHPENQETENPAAENKERNP
jgi:hypothetical protein